MKWFRLPCVDPVIEPDINIAQSDIAYPYYLEHGASDVVSILVENGGIDEGIVELACDPCDYDADYGVTARKKK